MQLGIWLHLGKMFFAWESNFFIAFIATNLCGKTNVNLKEI